MWSLFSGKACSYCKYRCGVFLLVSALVIVSIDHLRWEVYLQVRALFNVCINVKFIYW